MKKILLAAVAAMAMATTATAQEAVYGEWKSQPGETGGYIHVRLGPCGANVCGEITEVVGNDNTSIVGRTIIQNMAPQGGGAYSGGTIWAPDTDKTYKADMTMNGNSSLVVRGCVGICTGLTSRSQTWSRIR
ncbi:uncharacterized protein (DUF2147 family) [Loktanella ponticola]|uniref:Uncharacterized protein (DUF2147 family) n=1 Tax=Yoonia ponticola TaxID=1524255 RepID=A0A7W9EYI3_9RHOB|nr:DUF2147 domain-containing protein [Yoonia ponticola]MBB5722782.1 uncharacterized protein (DUF2147 family) [Yoonia ponticola]